MHSRLIRAGAALLFGAMLSGCRTPALIVDQTPEGRAELASVIAEALHRQSILLADDALTFVPMLVIERAAARDAGGLTLQGRELSKPAVFRLYRRAGHCLLVQGDAERWPLNTTRCIGINKPDDRK